MKTYPQIFKPLSSILDELNSGFLGNLQEKTFLPKTNIREEDGAYHLEIDLPGIKKEDVDINLDSKNNLLTIKAKRQFKNEVNEEKYHKVESFFGSYERSFYLPKNVDKENVVAKTENGVFELTLPKIEKTDMDIKKIEVQ